MAEHYSSLTSFLRLGKVALAKGPVALLLIEDGVEIASTLRHNIDAGFKKVIAFGSPDIPFPKGMEELVVRVDHDLSAEGAMEAVINGCIEAAPRGTWLYYSYNAEYLFHPFCEHRNIAEMLAFNTEERRDTVLTYVVDLYAGDLDSNPSAVCLDDAYLDKSGYYALARPDPANHNHPKERQLDFFGGLRWRFEEHIPAPRRRIDRVSLFRSKPGLRILPNHTFNDEEYNTYACPWHHNLTAAVCSFRTAKALKRNPGSTYDIQTFRWHNSATFTWHSQQLLDLGLMEPGQWF
ncbi:hypothetical protein EU803_11440 [Loktanella sp. IMCC34160]|uniref:hypothetical protein n=1 Tax=Loktanella sp. IMCC34160 TaxID=2510646 RepID=UPI00101BBCB8|nr:hypothetical protein [Loktanella sp. IMCC34160]RYG90610.1 hypothetical protein EU803_11440 [Loktanella sp. IMCC34160]